MEKIPTAKLFRETKLMDSSKPYTEEEIMIEFTKLHVEAALKLITTEATVETINKYSPEEQHIVNQDSILNSYPLEKIK
jgi:hypothetical protein